MPTTLERLRHALQQPRTGNRFHEIALEVHQNNASAAVKECWLLLQEGSLSSTAQQHRDTVDFLSNHPECASVDDVKRLLVQWRASSYPWNLALRDLVQKVPDRSYLSLPSSNETQDRGIQLALARAGLLSWEELPEEFYRFLARRYLACDFEPSAFELPKPFPREEHWKRILGEVAETYEENVGLLSHALAVVPLVSPARGLELLVRSRTRELTNNIELLYKALETHDERFAPVFAVVRKKLHALLPATRKAYTWKHQEELLPAIERFCVAALRHADRRKTTPIEELETLFAPLFWFDRLHYTIPTYKHFWTAFALLPPERKEQWLLSQPSLYWGGVCRCSTDKLHRHVIHRIRSWSRALPGGGSEDSPAPDDFRFNHTYGGGVSEESLEEIIEHTFKQFGATCLPALRSALDEEKTARSNLLVLAYLAVEPSPPAEHLLSLLRVYDKGSTAEKLRSRLVDLQAVEAVANALLASKRKPEQLALAETLARMPPSTARTHAANAMIEKSKDTAVRAILEPIAQPTVPAAPLAWWESFVAFVAEPAVATAIRNSFEEFSQRPESEQHAALAAASAAWKESDVALSTLSVSEAVLLTVWKQETTPGERRSTDYHRGKACVKLLGAIAAWFALWLFERYHEANPKSISLYDCEEFFRMHGDFAALPMLHSIRRNALPSPIKLVELVVKYAPASWKLFGLPPAVHAFFKEGTQDKRVSMKRACESGLALDPLPNIPPANNEQALDARLQALPQKTLPPWVPNLATLPPLHWREGTVLSTNACKQLLARITLADSEKEDEHAVLLLLRKQLRNDAAHALVEWLLQGKGDEGWNPWLQWTFGDALRWDRLCALRYEKAPAFTKIKVPFSNGAPDVGELLLWNLCEAARSPSSDYRTQNIIEALLRAKTFDGQLLQLEQQLSSWSTDAMGIGSISATERIVVQNDGQLLREGTGPQRAQCERALRIRSVSFPLFSSALAGWLERAMAREHDWPLDRWNASFNKTLLLSGLARTLVWEWIEGERTRCFAFDPKTKRWIHSDGSAWNASQGTVRIAHPARMSAEEQQRWQTHCTEPQPFLQLLRPVRSSDDASDPFARARSGSFAISPKAAMDLGFNPLRAEADGLVTAFAKQSLCGLDVIVRTDGGYPWDRVVSQPPIRLVDASWSRSAVDPVPTLSEDSPVLYSEVASTLIDLLAIATQA